MSDNIKKLIDIVHDIETEQIDADLLAAHPPEPEPDERTCADCGNCVKFGHNSYMYSYMCREKEGNESGRGESNIHLWDESCKYFKARMCIECLAPMTMTEKSNYMCSDCLDLRDRLRMDAREDGGVVR